MLSRYRLALAGLLGIAVAAVLAFPSAADEPAAGKNGASAVSADVKVDHPAAATTAEHQAGDPAAHTTPAATTEPKSIIAEFWYNFRHNLFKPLLLFFYLGFLVPIFHVKL